MTKLRRPVFDCRIATAHGVAYSALVNIETIAQIGRPPSRLQSPEAFPLEKMMLSSLVRGYGKPAMDWGFDFIPMLGLKYILDTYLRTGGVLVKSKAVTIMTRQTELGGYVRYNAYLVKPVVGKDYTEVDGKAMNLSLHFVGLEQF